MTGDLDLFGQAATSPRAARIGRRIFLPAAVRAQAEEMRRNGASGAEIACALGICEATVWKRLGLELERGLPGGRRAGRPKWAPTSDDRDQVAQLAAKGEAVERIAEVLGVTPPTIRRHCAPELARGRGLRSLRAANAVRKAERNGSTSDA